MRFAVLIALILALVQCRLYLAMEVNELEPDDMRDFLSDDSERYLLVAFQGSQCLSCKWQLYYANLITYFFERENDFIVGTIETDRVPDVAEFCDVDPESAKLEIRLISKGGARCFQHLDSETLTDFVTTSTGKMAKKSYVQFLNGKLYEKMTQNTQVSHFIEIMSPFERDCYDFSIQVEKAAEAFSMEPSVDFARIDCSLMHELCEDLKVVSTPSMIFLPAEGVSYNNTFPRLPTVDSIVLYLNEILGTHRTVDGGLDDTYGLNAQLNELAEEFMVAPVERRKEIMQHIRKERKSYVNSALYYGVMKEVMSKGPEVIFDHINMTVYQMNDLEITSEKYASLIARVNILRQFEPIEPTRALIMHTQNVDRILNGKRNVLVLFYDFRCPECRDFVEVYRAAFAKHPLSVYFASVNAARYETLRLRFNVTGHPDVRFFAAGEPLENNKVIPEKTADGIVEWLNHELATIHEAKKAKEMQEAMEMASALDEEDEEMIEEVEEVEEVKAEDEKEL